MIEDRLVLLCLFEGESPSNAFKIEVSSTKALSALKDLIFDENRASAFKDVAVEDLILWRGTVTDTDKDSAVTINNLSDKTKLDNPKAPLCDWFLGSPDTDTFIVVQRPHQASSPHSTLNGSARTDKKSSLDGTKYPAEIRGMFATSSRLIVCLVNEGLMRATYLPVNNIAPIENLDPVALLRLQDLSIVVSLAHTPIIDEQGAILFLDCQDLQCPIFMSTTLTVGGMPAQLTECLCPSTLMRLVAARIGKIEERLLNEICAELDSSVENMTHLFLHPHPEPTLNSTAIEWEQSIIEGHSSHPMHKTRYTVAPTPKVEPDTDLSNISLRLVSMPDDAVIVTGEYLVIMAKLVPADMMPVGRVPILVHPLQVPTVTNKFPEATLHPFTVPALAQASLRTVIIPGLPNYAFKFPASIRLTSALRTVSPWSVFMGPRLTPTLERIIPETNVLRYSAERSAVRSNHIDFDIARHLACIIRDDFGVTLQEQNEAVVICAALTERPDGNVARIIHVCNLNTRASRLEFLRIFVDLAFKAFLVPMIEHGFGFEAHQQNTLVRLPIPPPGDTSPVYPTGFIIRDFGGLRIHQDTLFKSTGMRVPVLPGNSIEATDIGKVYKVLYHTLIQMNLHPLIRALDLHYSGEGWSIVRTKLEEYFKPGDIGHELWLSSPTCQWKCFIGMRLQEVQFTTVNCDVPNILLYKGEP
ncbi:hypothetical protein BGZ68_005758 [Mortierella alpina]|nr:hypothetical protein BGZ68_005758 [Mortierella alpina]